MSEISNPNDPKQKPQRLMSLDALRGFDMFFIIGGGALITQFTKNSPWEWDNVIGEQMQHVAWEGIHAMDLVFPLFMFLAGVAIPYALSSKLERGDTKLSLLKKVFKRVLTLVVLGLVYNDALSMHLDSLRVASVLGQIGVAYGIAAAICIYSKHWRTAGYWCGGIMLGYAALQLWFPVPEFGIGELTREGSINAYIDQHYLPGRLYGGTFDPEGILCMVSASAIVLMGYLAGMLIRSESYTEGKKCQILAALGTGLILLGALLDPFYPVIKSLWTTTFNLYAGGISMLLLLGFYYVIDVLKFQKWAFFFTVIGVNSITIYLAHRFVDFGKLSNFIFGANSTLATVILLEWLFLYFLYKKKIYLKV